jgi:hypothetical protein
MGAQGWLEACGRSWYGMMIMEEAPLLPAALQYIMARFGSVA